MKKARNKAFQYLVVFIFMILYPFIQGNTQVINEYARIVNIFNADTTDVDSVEVNPNLFISGDTVLFIVMKGGEVNTKANSPIKSLWGKASDWHNMGIYNVLLVASTRDGICTHALPV